MQGNGHIDSVSIDMAGITPISDLLVPVWRRRWLILIITALVTIIGIVWAWLNPVYTSHGFFQFGGHIPMVIKKPMKEKSQSPVERDNGKEPRIEIEPGPGIALSDFKRFSASYGTRERFDDYIKDRKLENADGIATLRKQFSSRTGVPKFIEPVYPFTKLDAKELLDQPKDATNNVIGLRINYESDSPQTAQQVVGLLGQYAMDSIIYLIYSDMLRSQSEEIKTRMIELDNKIIEHKLQLEEYRRKIQDLKGIIARNPATANAGARPAMIITEETAPYLAPVTLLMAAEVRVSEAREAILAASQEQIKNQLLLEYYENVKKLLDRTKSGETVLRELSTIKESTFKNKDMRSDLVKAAYNMLSVENRRAVNLYLTKSRFIAGPTLPEHSATRIKTVIVTSFLLGLFISVVLVLSSWWWQRNQTRFSR